MNFVSYYNKPYFNLLEKSLGIPTCPHDSNLPMKFDGVTR